MIKLEVIVQPRSVKYLEFSQSLKSMKPNLQQLCDSVIITEKDSTFSIVAEMKTPEQLSKFLRTKEFAILSGAIKTLGEKSEVIIHGLDQKKKSTYINGIRFKYSKAEIN
ncbi:MAG: hypothetical protein QM503_12105 [Bacteroidota bacterium]